MAEETSLVGDHTSEWRKRPIDLWKVITSFVSQLSLGQDLTRVSLPTEICHPFSILELISLRELSYFHVLFDINNHPDDPEERFLSVVRWLCSLLQAEQMEKKPFNPVIGESHTAWIDHGEGNWSEFLAEQVSHHPPLSAFFVRNKAQNITLHSNLEFSVNFGGNSASVVTAGPVVLHTAFEDYTMDKMTPNMNIQRIIYGTKYFMWEGEFSVECKKTGYSAHFHVTEEDENTNRLTGKISHADKGVIYELNGITGSIINFWQPGHEEAKKQLVDAGKFKAPNISYPPKECRPKMDSLKLWYPVAKAIIASDMWAADEAKKKIEQNQRVREKAREASGADYDAQFFKAQKVDGKITQWTFNTDITVDAKFLEEMKKKVAEEEAVAAQEEAEAKRKAEEDALASENAALTGQQPAGEGENCVVS